MSPFGKFVATGILNISGFALVGFYGPEFMPYSGLLLLIVLYLSMIYTGQKGAK